MPAITRISQFDPGAYHGLRREQRAEVLARGLVGGGLMSMTTRCRCSARAVYADSHEGAKPATCPSSTDQFELVIPQAARRRPHDPAVGACRADQVSTSDGMIRWASGGGREHAGSRRGQADPPVADRQCAMPATAGRRQVADPASPKVGPSADGAVRGDATRARKCHHYKLGGLPTRQSSTPAGQLIRGDLLAPTMSGLIEAAFDASVAVAAGQTPAPPPPSSLTMPCRAPAARHPGRRIGWAQAAERTDTALLALEGNRDPQARLARAAARPPRRNRPTGGRRHIRYAAGTTCPARTRRARDRPGHADRLSSRSTRPGERGYMDVARRAWPSADR